MLSTLRCGCKRVESIFGAPASKLPFGDRNPNGIIRKFLDSHSSAKPVDFERAENATFDWLYRTFGEISPYHFNDIRDRLMVNTSPGLYFRAKGFRTKREVMESNPNLIRYQVHRLKSTAYSLRPKSFVCVVDSSLTPTGVVKNRVAWVYPLVITAAESMFFEGFRRKIVANPEWVPTPETMHDQFCGKSSRSYDFSNFDSSVPRWLIDLAFDMIKACINFGQYAPDKTGYIGVPYKGTSLEQLFDLISDYFVNTPFVSSTGFEGCKSDGVPSGSTFTNLVDTIISRMILEYIHTSKCNIRTYGDDCHVKCNCASYSTVEIETCRTLGFKLKTEEPNEHGCLTYCKAECHNGMPFHSGSWFAGIFLCCRPEVVGLTALCLSLSVKPTRCQARDLHDIIQEDGIYPPHPREELRLAKIVSGGLEHNLENLWKSKTMQCSSL